MLSSKLVVRLTIHGDKHRRLEVGPWSLEVVCGRRTSSARVWLPPTCGHRHAAANAGCSRDRRSSCRPVGGCVSQQAQSQRGRPAKPLALAQRLRSTPALVISVVAVVVVTGPNALPAPRGRLPTPARAAIETNTGDERRPSEG